MVRSMRMIPTDKVPTDTLESMKQLRSVKGGVRNVSCRHSLKHYIARFIVAKFLMRCESIRRHPVLR